jgi:DNA-binding response OmpR family regulator
MGNERILIVEDDPLLAQALDRELSKNYQTKVAVTGGDALFLAETEPFDLVLLDLNLPDMDGLEVAEQLRDVDADILMLTARGDVSNRVAGLYGGASDYVAKPFDMQELLARIYAVLRKRATPAIIRFGEVVFSEQSRTCSVAGVPIDLSAQEFRLLAVLLTNRGRVFSKGTIEERLYAEEGPDSNMIEVLVSRVRGKLADAGAKGIIQTIRGLGYVVR